MKFFGGGKVNKNSRLTLTESGQERLEQDPYNRLLVALGTTGGSSLSVRELSEQSHIPPDRVTKMVDMLVKKGLVQVLDTD